MTNSIKRPSKSSNDSYPHFTLASYTYYYCPSLQQILQIFDNDPITQHFQHQTHHLCPFKQLLALSSLAMSCLSSPIFIPSHLSSPANSAGNTPYIITSPPPDSPTNSKIVMVRSPCLSVVLVLEFSDRGISQIGSRPDVSIRKSS